MRHKLFTTSKIMEKEKAKVDAYEASLVAEEKILEGIRDSLKDMFLQLQSTWKHTGC